MKNLLSINQSDYHSQSRQLWLKAFPGFSCSGSQLFHSEKFSSLDSEPAFSSVNILCPLQERCPNNSVINVKVLLIAEIFTGFAPLPVASLLSCRTCDPSQQKVRTWWVLCPSAGRSFWGSSREEHQRWFIKWRSRDSTHRWPTGCGITGRIRRVWGCTRVNFRTR